MNLLPGTQYLTASTSIGTINKPIRVFSVEAISGGTAGTTLLLRNGNSASGNIYIQVDGTTSKSALKTWYAGVRFPSGCYASVDTLMNSATVVYTEEF